jgi:hypothetical protein
MKAEIEPHGIIKQAYAYWERVRGDRSVPCRADVDPTEIPSILPHLILIDVTRNPLDFRFRLVGTYVDRHVNDSYTGKRHRDVPTKGPGSTIWRNLSRVVETGAPHVGYLGYNGPVDGIQGVEEAILPLGGDGHIDMLMNVLVFVRETQDHFADPRYYRHDLPVDPGAEEERLFRLAFEETA